MLEWGVVAGSREYWGVVGGLGWVCGVMGVGGILGCFGCFDWELVAMGDYANDG